MLRAQRLGAVLAAGLELTLLDEPEARVTTAEIGAAGVARAMTNRSVFCSLDAGEDVVVLPGALVDVRWSIEKIAGVAVIAVLLSHLPRPVSG